MSEAPGPEGRAAAPAGPAPDAEGMSGAQRLIARFGGIRPMASKLGVAVSTVQGWRERGAIPARHHERVRGAAKTHGIEIDPADLAGAPRSAVPTPSPLRPAKPSAPEPQAEIEVKLEPHPERSEFEAKIEAEPEPELEPAPEAQPEPSPRPGTASEAEPEPGPGAEPELRPGPAPRPGPSPAAPSAKRAWLGGAGLGALVLAAGLGLAVVARDLWTPWLDPEYGLADAGDSMGVERRLAALESARAAAPAAGAERLEGLRQGLIDLSARIEALEARASELAAAAPGGDVTSAARLAELDARLEDFAARTEGLDALPGLAARLDGLAGRVGDLARLRERVAGLSALDERVEALSALQARVAALAEAQGEARGALSGQAALRLGVERLSEALRGSGPFAAELGLLQDLAASDALPVGAALQRLLAPIVPHAEAGIPSLAALEAGFPEVARAVRLATPAGAEDDWVDGVLRRLSMLVTVRRLDPEGRVAGAGADAVVARAQDQLEAGGLAAALAELEGLEGPAAEAARPWAEGAAARLAARRALTGLGRLLLGQLDTGGG